LALSKVSLTGGLVTIGVIPCGLCLGVLAVQLRLNRAIRLIACPGFVIAISATTSSIRQLWRLFSLLWVSIRRTEAQRIDAAVSGDSDRHTRTYEFHPRQSMTLR
jgi:hypothetical protein